MDNSAQLLLIIGLPLAALLYFQVIRPRQRRQRAELLHNIPWSDSSLAELQRAMPQYRFLNDQQQKNLRGQVMVFLDRVKFAGCGGLEVNEEMKLTVAAQACLLTLHHDNAYRNLNKVLLYPQAYVDNHSAEVQVRLGESTTFGTVVLAWDASLRGIRNLQDGHNVMLHEFAHQLDQDDGHADGLPAHGNVGCYRSWGTLMSKKFEDLCRKTDKGKKTVMDDYGATNPAEFFAVATETFFEKPRQMNRKHPQLYSMLKEFYGLNPLEWQ